MVIHRRNCEQLTGWTSSKNAWNVRQVQLLNVMSVCSSTVICLICSSPVRFEFFCFFFHFHGFNQFVVHRHFPPSLWWQGIIPSSISSFALPAGSSRPRRVLVQGFHVLVLFWTRMPREQTALAVSVIDGRHWTFSSHQENTNNKQQNVHFFFWLYFFFLGPFFNSRSLIIFCAGHKSDRDSISMLWYRQTPSRWAQDNGERARSIISRGRKTIFLLLLLLRPFLCVCVTT